MNFDLSWMAWTPQTAIFFCVIALLLATMTFYTARRPIIEKMGIFRFPTTPGDRLFISLLGAAWICVIWIAVMGTSFKVDLGGVRDLVIWPAFGLSLIWAAFVFRFV